MKLITALILSVTAITAQAGQLDGPLASIGFTKTNSIIENGQPHTIYTKSMDYQSCNGFIRKMSSNLGSVPRNVIENNEVRLVMWDADFGKLMIGCSTRSGKAIVTTIGA
jgi:hypothetical protein